MKPPFSFMYGYFVKKIQTDNKSILLLFKRNNFTRNISGLKNKHATKVAAKLSSYGDITFVGEKEYTVVFFMKFHDANNIDIVYDNLIKNNWFTPEEGMKINFKAEDYNQSYNDSCLEKACCDCTNVDDCTTVRGQTAYDENEETFEFIPVEEDDTEEETVKLPQEKDGGSIPLEAYDEEEFKSVYVQEINEPIVTLVEEDETVEESCENGDEDEDE